MFNLIATCKGKKPILIRNIEPLEQNVTQLLTKHGWVIKQWEPKPKLHPVFAGIINRHFPGLKVS